MFIFNSILMHSVGNYLFSYSDLLGHGAFALVYKGYNRGLKNEPVAIKKIRKSSFSSLLSKERKEIAILSGLKHENIVSMLDFEETVSDIFLVLEFCNLGDLNDLLLKHNKISEDHIRLIFGQVGSAISFLHSLQIIHRDLKPQNILLHSKYPYVEMSENSIISTSMFKFTNLIAKIGDFGFARVLSDTTMATTLCGSPLYMAPEVLLGQSYGSKVDMWSLGTIIYQCFTGFAPFIAKTPQQLRKRYETDLKLQPTLPIQASPQLNSLILALLKRDSRVRLGYNEFSQHPFFQPLKLLSNVDNSASNKANKCIVDNINEYPNKIFVYSADIVYSTTRACFETNFPECKYMFATPLRNIESTRSSVCPPHTFDINQNLEKKHKSVSYQEAEKKSSMAGYVLLPNFLSDCKMQSRSPSTANSFGKKLNLSVIIDVPFSSLAPFCDQSDEKTKSFSPGALIHCDDVFKTSISFPPNNSDIFDLSIIEQSHHLKFKNDGSSERENSTPNLSNNPKNWRFSQENTCLDKVNVHHLSFPIATMFFNTGSEDNVKLFHFDEIPLELEVLHCPYEPSCSTSTDLELFPAGNYFGFSTLSDNHNYPLTLNEEYIINSKPIDFVGSEKVTLKDLPTINPLLHSPCPSRHYISDVGCEYGLIERYHRTIILCRYIFDTINFIKQPFFSSSFENSSISSICTKSVSRCDLKVLVLLVKVVTVISNILEPNKSNPMLNKDFSVYERSMFQQHKDVMVKLLVRAKLELSKFNLSYLTSATKFDFYHSINSAETLIYKYLVEICQIATLENVFNRSDRYCVENYIKANLLSRHLSQTTRDSSFFKMDQFGSCTKEAILNYRTLP